MYLEFTDCCVDWITIWYCVAFVLHKARPIPPPEKYFFIYMGGLFATFSPYGIPFSLCEGPFSLCDGGGGHFCRYCAFLGLRPLPPPPTKISVGAHDILHRTCIVIRWILDFKYIWLLKIFLLL